MAFGTKRRKRNVAVDRRIDSRRERERGRYNHYNYLAATVSLPRKRNREEEKEKKMEKKKMAEKRFGGCEQKMDITRKREGTRQVHRERLLYYSQANRCNDIRMPFVSFVVRYKTALRASNDIDHLRSFRPFSFSLPPFSYPMLSLSLSLLLYDIRIRSCSFFLLLTCHFLLHFHQPLSLRPSPFFLFVILLSDSAIRQIAQTNDEPSGKLFRTVYELLFPAPHVPGISES